MQRILVWDIPTRALHWLLSAALIAALAIALGVDDDRRAFQLHMLFGLIAGFVVILRLLWGIAGSRYARFGSFLFGPTALLGYLHAALRGRSERRLGHNPGAAYAIYGMLLLVIGLATSGLLLPGAEALEELHEVMAYLLIALIAAHLIGLAWHTIRERENIAFSMIDGRKAGDPAQAIRSSRPLAGAVCLTLCAAWAVGIFSGYDARAGLLRLPVLGQTLRLGEHEEEGTSRHEKHRRERHEHHEDHDEDDD